MTTPASSPTHEVIRPGIKLGGGQKLEPGDLVDTSSWLPRLRFIHEKRGTIRPIQGTIQPSDAGQSRRRREG